MSHDLYSDPLVDIAIAKTKISPNDLLKIPYPARVRLVHQALMQDLLPKNWPEHIPKDPILIAAGEGAAKKAWHHIQKQGQDAADLFKNLFEDIEARPVSNMLSQATSAMQMSVTSGLGGHGAISGHAVNLLRYEAWGGKLFIIDHDLQQRLDNTDIDLDLPASVLKLPYNSCYFHIGHTVHNKKIYNELSGWHAIEGMLCNSYETAEYRYIEIVAIGSPAGKKSVMDDAYIASSIIISKENENDPICSSLASMRQEISEHYPTSMQQQIIDSNIATREALVKILLYIASDKAHLEVKKERSAALANIAAKGVKKAAKAERRLAKLFDYILVGANSKITTSTKSDDATQTHTSTHFRRGHFRNQAHGPQKSLRKVLWIEPTIVNPNGESRPSKPYFVQ